MDRALTAAATGLQAQQKNIERISADLANVNTDGYKQSRTEFQDLMYETLKKPGESLGVGSQSPVGIQTGMGVKIGGSYKLFEQGPARNTYSQYDLMIEGKGFFPVQTPGGEIAYTRTGAFHIDAQGRLQTAGGSQLVPPIVIPSDALKVSITSAGEVKADMSSGEEIVLGQIQLVTFVNEQGLSAMGANLYQPTLGSGQPLQGIPGESGFGIIQQGALEGSTVNVPNSMVDMITTQRAYEMGTKVMHVVDQMMGSTVNVK